MVFARHGFCSFLVLLGMFLFGSLAHQQCHGFHFFILSPPLSEFFGCILTCAQAAYTLFYIFFPLKKKPLWPSSFSFPFFLYTFNRLFVVWFPQNQMRLFAATFFYLFHQWRQRIVDGLTFEWIIFLFTMWCYRIELNKTIKKNYTDTRHAVSLAFFSRHVYLYE